MDPFWVVSADMGYGHQRAVWPFRDVAHGGIIAAGDNEHASPRERALWKRYLRIYETFSRAKGIPLVGKQLFGLLDKLLRIPSMYPIRNLSASTFQVDMLDTQLRKGLGTGVMSIIEQQRLPLLTSFYVPALVADKRGYEPIYTIICDADLNRVWVAKEPWDSTINYFAPCGRAAQRLRSYGVPTERIFLTGFPLDTELLGGRDLATLKHDLGIRLSVLDPRNRFHLSHGPSVEHFLGPYAKPNIPPGRCLHITYAVGGAGAQKEIGAQILRSLRRQLLGGAIRVTLVAGTRVEVRNYFELIRQETVGDCPYVEVLYRPQLHDYFAAFHSVIRNTDILWTKPSELSFYCGLGLPIVMSPAIGSQEKFNRRWLLETGAGMRQNKPEHTAEWLNELLLDGRFADMAWLGFLRARKLGTYHALDVLRRGSFDQSDDPLKR
jgi:hypothetical protein